MKKGRTVATATKLRRKEGKRGSGAGIGEHGSITMDGRAGFGTFPSVSWRLGVSLALPRPQRLGLNRPDMGDK